MKKIRLWTLLLTVGILAGTIGFAAADVAINAANFPDSAFLKAIREGGYDYNADGIISAEERYDQNQDGNLTDAEIANVKIIECKSMNIRSVKGIENFTALTHLFLYGNNLETLDTGDNPELILLECGYNGMTSLNISRNQKLEVLYCQDNKLTKLDVSKNKKLEHIAAGDNELTELDLSQNVNLQVLGCYRNRITSLNVSRNTAMTYLICYGNKLDKLDVSKNTKLICLSCAENQLKSLDVSHNPSLTELDFMGNQLSSIDIGTNRELVTLHTEFNKIKTLDISACPKLCGYLKTYQRRRDTYYDRKYDFWGDDTKAFLSCDTTVKVIGSDIVSEPTEVPPAVGDEFVSDGLKYKITSSSAATFTGLEKAGSKASLEIPASVQYKGKTFKITGIGKKALAGDSKVKTVRIGKQIKTIGANAFASCTKLWEISGADAVTKIGDSAFSGCKALKSIPVFSKLNTIGNRAFQGCVRLKKLTLAKGVNSIGKAAFKGCSNLKTITVKTKKLKSSNVGADAFKGIYKKATIKCPKGKKEAYKKLFLKKGAPKTCNFI